ALRGFKKINPGKPSHISGRRPSEPQVPTVKPSASSAPLPQRTNRPPVPHHARSLSLQDSLKKPLPEPPPPQLSPASPISPIALPLQARNLASAVGSGASQQTQPQRYNPSPAMDSASAEMGGGLYARGAHDVSAN